MSFFNKKRNIVLLLVVVAIIAFVLYVRLSIVTIAPVMKDESALSWKRDTISNNYYQVKNDWLKKNKYGLWELSLSGSAFEMGVKNGILCQELIDYQEEAFVESINEMIPSESYLKFLKTFIILFNRNIDEYIPEEYKQEIYGISKFANSKYEYIGPNYHRILNYHAAHDIGHTLQNMNLVACTAFGVRNERSKDSSMLIGRNMDFYTSDKFAENKIIAFCKPDNGHNFAYVTWGGLIGVISGMNEHGLTITLNAAKSSIPLSSKMPVSILARKILQYATTIEEAYSIAKEHETFVAEAFLIGSATDNQLAIIEKTPEDIDLYQADRNEIILSNHYQGEKFKNSEKNIEAIEESSSMYRWKRTKELLDKKETHDYKSFAHILRDTRGLGDKDIGLGNETAINQLIAHHSVIFKPQQRQMWVSTSPYQLGAFIVYDLNKVFADSLNYKELVYDSLLTIPADTLLNSVSYANFIKFKEITASLKTSIDNEKDINYSVEKLQDYINLNKEFFQAYYMVGEYYRYKNDTAQAASFYKKALTKTVPSKPERDKILKRINTLKEVN